MDDLGNRTGSQDLRSGSESYSVDDVTNRYESIAGNDLTYDAAGNLTTDKDGYQYSYDYENRLILVKDSSNAYVAEYKYDALGRRVFTVVYRPTPLMPIITLNYHNAQWQVLAEYEYDPIAQEQNFARRFVYGNYIDEPLVMTDAKDDDYYYVQDHLYNVTALLDETGAVVERYEYDAYGKMTHLDPDFSAFSGTDHNNPYLFTGRRLDVLDGGDKKIYYYRHRYMDAETGRFLTEDPAEFVDGMSLYEYVASNPVICIDAFGLKWNLTFGIEDDPGILAQGPKLGDYMIKQLQNSFISHGRRREEFSKKEIKKAQKEVRKVIKQWKSYLPVSSEFMQFYYDNHKLTGVEMVGGKNVAQWVPVKKFDPTRLMENWTPYRVFAWRMKQYVNANFDTVEGHSIISSSFSMTSAVGTGNDTGHSLHSFSMWGKFENIECDGKYITGKLTLNVRDFFDFERRGGIMDWIIGEAYGLSPNMLLDMHEAGVMREFFVLGSITGEVKWKKGDDSFIGDKWW